MRNLTQLATGAAVALFVIFLTISQHRASSTRIQMFTLYDDTGQTENYTDNVKDLGKVSKFLKLDQLAAVCSQLGVWAFFASVDFGEQNSYGYHPATPDWTCNTRRIGTDHGIAAVHSIRHLGSGDLDHPAISLYKEPYFASDELYFDGDIISLPITHKFYSFGFTGNESWTLYVSTNFTGHSECLRPNLTDGSGVTYETQRNLFVGSITKGCVNRRPRLFDGNNQTTGNTIDHLTPGGKKTACLELQDYIYNSPLVISGNELRLPEPEPFDSFTLQRNTSWTVYRGMEFNGDFLCLRNNEPELNSTKGALNYRFVNPPFLIGSVRQGCEDDEPKPLDNSTVTPNLDNLTETTTLSATTTDFPNSVSLDKSTTLPTMTTDWTRTELPPRTEWPPRTEVPSRTEWPWTQIPTTTEWPRTEFPTRTEWPARTESPNRTEPPRTEYPIRTEWPPRTEWPTTTDRTNSAEWTTNTVFPDNYDNDEITEPTIGRNSASPAESQGRDSSTRRGKNLDFGDDGDTTPQPEFETTTNYYDSYSSSTRGSESEPLMVTKSPVSDQEHHGHSMTTIHPHLGNENITDIIGNFTIPESPTGTNEKQNSTKEKTQELVSESGAGSLFFIAFLVVLGLLILCMLITLGLFVYFRATRHRHDELPTTID